MDFRKFAKTESSWTYPNPETCELFFDAEEPVVTYNNLGLLLVQAFVAISETSSLLSVVTSQFKLHSLTTKLESVVTQYFSCL